MPKTIARFVNEYGNYIEMSLETDERGVMIKAVGPDSEVEHTWTHMEAAYLRSLLGDVVYIDGRIQL